jgi:glycosyltransferase involved in cell wall biosynthesis
MEAMTEAAVGRPLPRISVITPSFNQGRYLAQTLDSVLSQGYPNLEYIVIDGGSSDDSIEHLRARSDRLAYWYSEKDAGHADALNKGFRRATGDVLTFINSDDYLLPGSLWAVAKYFSQHPVADMLYGNLQFVDAYGRLIMERRMTRFFASGYLWGGSDLLQPGTFWRRRVYETVGEFSLEYLFSFDAEFFYRAVLGGARVEFTRQFLAAFRVHPDAKTARLQDVAAANMRALEQRFLSPHFDSVCGDAARAGFRMMRMLLYFLQGDGVWLCRRLASRFGSGPRR